MIPLSWLLGAFILIAVARASITRFWFHKLDRDSSAYVVMRSNITPFVSVCTLGALAAYPVSALSSAFAVRLLQRTDNVLGFNGLATLQGRRDT